MNINKKNALAYIDAKADLFTEISRKIWDYSELSLKEYKSAACYVEACRNEGFKVEEGICGIPTAFAASAGSGRPVIGILAEYDALSGLSQKAGAVARKARPQTTAGHGCGHNMLGAGSFAAACAVKDYLERTGASGTVVFYGCPGEEGGASKAFMAREGLWKKLDAAITWHPDDVNQVATGTCNSCIQVLYKFKGVAAHAAGNPEMGRSALDAVELMNVGVQYLREHMKSDCRIHYAMVDGGGLSPNVVQPTASVLYMVRSVAVADSLALQKRVDDIAKGAALMTGTALKRIFVDGTANTVPNSVLEKLAYDNMCGVPLPSYSDDELHYAKALRRTYDKSGRLPGMASSIVPEIGEKVRKMSDNGAKDLNDFVIPFYTGGDFSPGSTDVGDVSWLTPTVQINTVCEPADVPGHSWQIVSCGAGSIGDKGLLYAGKVMSNIAIDLYERPELLKEAKAEFKKRTAGGYDCPIPEGAKPYIIEE